MEKTLKREIGYKKKSEAKSNGTPVANPKKEVVTKVAADPPQKEKVKLAYVWLTPTDIGKIEGEHGSLSAALKTLL